MKHTNKIMKQIKNIPIIIKLLVLIILTKLVLEMKEGYENKKTISNGEQITKKSKGFNTHADQDKQRFYCTVNNNKMNCEPEAIDSEMLPVNPIGKRIEGEMRDTAVENIKKSATGQAILNKKAMDFKKNIKKMKNKFIGT